MGPAASYHCCQIIGELPCLRSHRQLQCCLPRWLQVAYFYDTEVGQFYYGQVRGAIGVKESFLVQLQLPVLLL